ncbi:MAG TPA: TonB family protein [Nitrospirota bacterium]|nr:TonB family protein [Nitrospirota bacterium]
MPRHLHFTISLLLSFAFHALVIAAVFFLASSPETPLPTATPVRIVNLPPERLKRLPPVARPLPLPERSVPTPGKFGGSDEVRLPRTLPGLGRPEGEDRGKTDKGTTKKEQGPLPFLTQRDIDELARKGMPGKRPGDESVTLDTDEFKFISYNRWLKYKVESVLRYPELAALTGLQGTLYIQFDIMKDGALGNLELIRSSGYKILDDEALRSIRATAPFQPLPDGWNMDHYTIRAAVLFYLNEAYIR